MERPDALVIIGSGTPTPTPERFGTACVLKLGGDRLLFDCGPAATHKLVRAGFWPTDINWLFITHHHFDHTADLACFLLCRWDQSTGKEVELRIFGPPPTREVITKLVGPDGAYVDDWKARVGFPISQRVHVNRGGSLPRPLPRFAVDDVGPGKILEHGGWTVTACRADHAQPWLESLAYRVDTPRGSILFAGDTGPCDEVRRLAQEADVFVANAWDLQETIEETGEAPGQTGTLDAARFAAGCGAKTLVLIHTGRHLCEPAVRRRALKEIAAVFPGRTVFGEEELAVPLWKTQRPGRKG